MTISEIAAVAIGLVLTYSILSLIASQLKEAIAGVLKWRAAQLETALQAMLTDAVAPAKPAGNAPDGSLPTGNAPLYDHATGVFKAVYDHALVSGGEGKPKPFFVPARNVTLALLSAIGKGDIATTVQGINTDIAALPPGNLKQTLQTLVAGADNTVESVRTAIDTWFNQSMDLLSSKYKEYAQRWTFGLGLILAIVFNVDTISIVETLGANPTLVTAADIQKVQAMAQKNDAKLNDEIAGLLSLPIKVGWPTCAADQSPCPKAYIDFWSWDPARWVLRLIGWLLTGAAISLGAPFWFDLLDQFVGRGPAKNDTPA